MRARRRAGLHAHLEICPLGLGGIAHPNARGHVGVCRRGIGDELNSGICPVLCSHRVKPHADVLGPGIAAQLVEPEARLRVADEHDLARLRAASADLVLRFRDGLGSGDERPAHRGVAAEKLHRAEPLPKHRRALAGWRVAPFAEADGRPRLFVEEEERDLILQPGRSRGTSGFLQRLSRQILAPHARAGIDEDGDPFPRLRRAEGLRLREKGARKGEGEKREDEAAEDEQEDVLEA